MDAKQKLEAMTARQQLEAIRNAPAHVIVLDETLHEVEIHEFVNIRQARIFVDALELPEGYSTIVGADVLGFLGEEAAATREP